MASALTLFWFRRDLRIADNVGLKRALASGRPVAPVFIFDQNILKSLKRDDARVTFIHQALDRLGEEIEERGGQLTVFHGRPLEVFRGLFLENKIESIYCNEDYEPYARERDDEVAALAKERGVGFHAFKDQVIFNAGDVLKDDSTPYRMFTPYYRRWKEKLRNIKFESPQTRGQLASLGGARPTLEDIGFRSSALELPPRVLSRSKIKAYTKTRDDMSLDATTRMGIHLRFGTVSVRACAKLALELSETWLRELAWREFFMQILYHFPRTVSEPFDERYRKVEWINDEKQFQLWREGRTGYPIVDAGMRELNATGFMHNRARMIVGSFLTKHLLIDWRWGERYFAEKLLDFELASNVGNWQWVAGSGCDAAPYFRIFNPALQAKKFDAQGGYVRRWVPEAGTKAYVEPIVDHETARRRALVTLNRAMKEKA